MSDNRINPQGLNLEIATRLTTAQQVRFARMLEMTAPELDEAVEREVDANPALELLPADLPAESDKKSDSIPFYRRNISNYSPDDERPDFSPADDNDSLYDFVLRQISELDVDGDVAEAARYLAGNIDSNGYIRRDLGRLAEDMEFNHGLSVEMPVMENAFRLIRSLEPAGVGAVDLRDSLLLQLKRLPESQTRDDAIRIIETMYEDFLMLHYHVVASALSLSEERIRDSFELIRSLNPKPGAMFSYRGDSLGNVIIPDFIVENIDGRLSVSLNNNFPELGIQQSFVDAVNAMSRTPEGRIRKRENEFVYTNYTDARSYIQLVEQRQLTMMKVMSTIVSMQSDYFMTEDVSRLRPMLLKDIAEATGLNISTVSRVTNNKFVATPWGIFPLRFFFSDNKGRQSAPDDPDAADGDDVENPLTRQRIVAEIRKVIDEEDKKRPLSDQKLCAELLRRGLNVSRRTVSKYRERAGIPVSRLRRTM